MDRLRKNSDFKETYSRGKSVGSRYIVLFYKRNGTTANRIGFTASKKVGNSVQRNRARRLMKEACRHLDMPLKTGYDLVAIARVTINEAAYREVLDSFEKVVRRAGLVK